jgi:hypothetical protein
MWLAGGIFRRNVLEPVPTFQVCVVGRDLVYCYSSVETVSCPMHLFAVEHQHDAIHNVTMNNR